MIPPWLIKVAPYAGAVALVAGAVWYIDHRGFQRAETEATARATELELHRANIKLDLQKMVKDSEDRMSLKITEADKRLAAQVGNIDRVNRTIVQPTLIREIQNEARLSDPAAGITDGVRETLNTARSLSERPCPAGSNAVACFSLSPAQPAE